MSKTGKVSSHHWHQSWNSCRKVASDRESAFASAPEPAKKKQNALWLHYTWPLTLAKHVASAVQMHWSTHLFCPKPMLEFCLEMMVIAFSSCARILGECLTIHSYLHFFSCFCFKVEISSHTLIPLFRPESVHIGLASWDDCDSVPWQVACELVSDRCAH